MAGYVRKSYSKMPKENRQFLADTKRVTSQRTVRMAKSRKIEPLTPIKEIRSMANKSSRKNNISIKLGEMPTGSKYADAVHVYDKSTKKQDIILHPVLQYYDKRYVKDVIHHELDHAKVRDTIISHHG
jgi:hypothetical protein